MNLEKKMETGLLSCIESRVEMNGSLYGRFELSAFPAGQALTLANALRRTLLSELSGLAIVAVDIQGINHEYSNFIGMRESILDFLLNLKKVVLTTESNLIKPQMGSLRIQGPAVVRASDLKLPNSIACVNPNQYLATLSVNGFLQIKFYICQGKNSLPGSSTLWINSLNNLLKKEKNLEVSNSLKVQNLSLVEQKKTFEKKEAIEGAEAENTLSLPLETHEKPDMEVKTNLSLLNTPIKVSNQIESKKKSTLLALDPVFMPITQVNFIIQTQDNCQEFCEKIILEIWTTGSIHPKKALYQAIKKLICLFTAFQHPLGLINPIQKDSVKIRKIFLENVETLTFQKSTKSSFDIEKKILCLDIANLDLSIRSYTYLKRANINTIGDLIEYSAAQLLLLKNFGKRSLKEVEKNLLQIGLCLSQS